MEQRINKNMRSETVCRMADRLRIPERVLWELYYESGCIYLEELAELIKRKRVFDAMFRGFLSDPRFGRLPISEVFDEIRFSETFWFWWSVQLWTICQNNSIKSINELGKRLVFIDALIPHFLLKQIFYGKQKPKCRQREAGISASEVTATDPAKRKVRKRVGSGI